MSTVVVDVRATVGSPIEECLPGGLPVRLPVGWGVIRDTMTENGEPAEALVLMHEPALPGVLRVRPVALLHLAGHVPAEELLCVATDASFDAILDVVDLAQRHAEPEVWAATLDRLTHSHGSSVAGCEACAEAERLLEEAFDSYCRLTGSLG